MLRLRAVFLLISVHRIVIVRRFIKIYRHIFSPLLIVSIKRLSETEKKYRLFLSNMILYEMPRI